MAGTSYTLQVRIKLLSPFLGDIKTPTGRKLNTKKVGDVVYWKPQISQWRWAMKEALDSFGLQLETSVDFIRFPVNIKAPKISAYQRAFHVQDGRKNEIFESFAAGAVISFQLFVLSSLEGQNNSMIQLTQRPPTKEEVINCLKLVGANIGLSPWGSKYDYGRFVLLQDQTGVDQVQPAV